LARVAGVRIATGTDAFGIVPTELLWREVALLVAEGGFTPGQALHAATGAAAELLGIEARAGRVAPRLRADLVLVEGDTLSDVPSAVRIRAVWRAGRRVR
jgi:imidazolonepropionase-like amidohydrolase